MKQYESILKVISVIKNTYMLDVTIKDYCGFVPANEHLDSILRPYLAHTNPYCLFVKNIPNGYLKCMNQKKILYKKCKEKEPFIGYCHAGVGELVVPILNNNTVIGSVNISHISHDSEKAKHLFSRTFKNLSIQEQKHANVLYAEFMKPTTTDISSILVFLELLSECLGSIAKTHMADNRNDSSNNNSLMDRIDSYLREHYAQKITVPKMAKDISVPAKNISLTVQKVHKMSFNNYLNRIRIEASEALLLKSNLSIEEIALSVGFFDVPYFKKVFNSIINISPEDFVRYYKNETFEPLAEN